MTTRPNPDTSPDPQSAERLRSPAQAPVDPGASRAPHATSEAVTQAADTQDDATTGQPSPTDGKTAREEIANLLWWSVPSSTDEEAKARTGQLLDAHRAEVLREAEGKAREIVAKLWVDGTTQKQLDRAGGARAVEWEIGLMASGTAEHDQAQAEAPDTLPAWLYQRFAAPDAPAWATLTDDDRAYWEHHARAVRRAVARGGFKAGEVSA